MTTTYTPAEAMAAVIADAIKKDEEFLPVLRNAVARAEREGCRRCHGGPGMLHWIGVRGADLGACHRCEGTGSGLTGCQNRLALVEARIAAWKGEGRDAGVEGSKWSAWLNINREAHKAVAAEAGTHSYKAHLDVFTSHSPASDLHARLVEAVVTGKQVGPVRPATMLALVEAAEARETAGV